MSDRAQSIRRRHRQSPEWWAIPRRRERRARLAHTIGLPPATALCLVAIALVIVRAVVV